jgi:hypothetical protein
MKNAKDQTPQELSMALFLGHSRAHKNLFVSMQSIWL